MTSMTRTHPSRELEIITRKRRPKGRLFYIPRVGEPGPSRHERAPSFAGMSPRDRHLPLVLRESASSASRFANEILSLQRFTDPWPEIPARKNPARPPEPIRGRPLRSERIDPELVRNAPAPEIALAPAQDVPAILREMDFSHEKLEEIMAYENAHFGRKSVKEEIEKRIRILVQQGRGKNAAP